MAKLVGLYDLAAELQSIKKQAKLPGMFADDRELLECHQCGLKEDVTGHGILITYKGDVMGIDIGLRFPEPDEDGKSVCPVCGEVVWLKEEVGEDDDDISCT